MQLIDTNVILRFILNDNIEMPQCAADIIASGAYTKPEVIAEVVYVMKSVYAAPRDKIKSILHGLSGIIQIENADYIIYAADLFASTTLNFLNLTILYLCCDKDRKIE